MKEVLRQISNLVERFERNIEGYRSLAYQLRRYAWSPKLPLSILTDFEEMAIHDCCLRPKPSDKPRRKASNVGAKRNKKRRKT